MLVGMARYIYKLIWALGHRVDRWRIKKLTRQVFKLKKENIKLKETLYDTTTFFDNKIKPS